MRFRFSVSGQADLEAEPANDHDDHECSHMSEIASPASRQVPDWPGKGPTAGGGGTGDNGMTEFRIETDGLGKVDLPADKLWGLRRSARSSISALADFKAKVALEALRGELTTTQLATKHGIPQTMVGHGRPTRAAPYWGRPNSRVTSRQIA
jgi:hypothetical protein